MNRIGSCRVHADQNRFIVMDSTADPHADMPEWTQEATGRGFVANDRVIHVRTLSRMQEHWVDMFQADTPLNSAADRGFSTDLEITSGRLLIRDSANPPATAFEVNLPAGRYAVHILTRNIGGGGQPEGEPDPREGRDLTDDDLKYGPGIERYQITLVRQD